MENVSPGLKLKRIVRDFYNKKAGFAEVMDVASVLGLPLDDRLIEIVELARMENEREGL